MGLLSGDCSGISGVSIRSHSCRWRRRRTSHTPVEGERKCLTAHYRRESGPDGVPDRSGEGALGEMELGLGGAVFPTLSLGPIGPVYSLIPFA